MIVAKELLLYIPWWFWFAGFSYMIYVIYLFLKRSKTDPILLRISYLLSSLGLFLMMFDALIFNSVHFVKYRTSFLITIEIFVAIMLIFLMGIGCYQKGNRPDFDPNLKRAINKFLRGGIIILLCLGLVMLIVYLI